MRWFLLSSPVLRGGDLVADEKGIVDAVRSAIHPLWSAWYFFTLYANADNVDVNIGRTDATGVLDRYLLAKSHDLVLAVTERMDAYDLSGACEAVGSFLDVLTNWYIRRSRDRFWGTSGTGDSQDAFDTMGTVLEVLFRTAAPLLPLVSEAVWRGLTAGSPESSVHLSDWPDASLLPADPDLVTTMDRVREVCSAAHSVRKAQGLRARLPLASLTVAAPDADRLAPFKDLIEDEVNVKSVELTDAVDEVADRQLTVVFKVAAPRLGPLTQQVAAAAKVGDWQVDGDGRARVGPAVLEPGEFELRLKPRSEATSRGLPGEDGLVILDTDVSPELEEEGLARDVVRLVQQARRDAGFQVTDRIHLELSGPADVVRAVSAYQPWVQEQTLAVQLDAREASAKPEGWQAAELPEGRPVWLRVRRAASN
jgi:isoleucyl-tRNA synthetase